MKYLLAFVLTFNVFAGSIFEVTRMATKTGVYAKVTNKTPYYIICTIGPYEVSIEPWSSSLWYKLPNKRITCRKQGISV